LLAVAAALVVPAAIAWACNPQAHLSLDQTSYSPGEQIRVSGSYFANGDSIAVSTPGSSASATVAGGGFTVTLRAPAEAGSFTVVAQRSDGYRAGLPKSASYQVVAAASPPPSERPSAPPAQPNPTFQEPGVAQSPGSGLAGSGGGGGGGSQGGEPGGGPTGGVGGGGGFATGTGGQAVFAGSAAPGQQGAFISGSGGGAAGSAAKSTAGRPSEQAATSDVWSAFAPGRTPSLTNGVAGAPDGGTGSGLGIGIGLLALGLLGLVAGLTAAEVRRRRALAGQ
jgi:hypothetical protein